MGWGNPWVIASLAAGAGLLVAFPFIESHVADPMFRLELFKIKRLEQVTLLRFSVQCQEAEF